MKRFLNDQSGASVVLFTLVLPVMCLLLGGIIDYSYWLSDKALIQDAADSAALTAAKEMRLGALSSSSITAAARNRALGILGDLADQAKVQIQIPNQTTISVNVDVPLNSIFGNLSPLNQIDMQAHATAQSASTPTCLIALNPKGSGPAPGPSKTAGAPPPPPPSGGPGSGGITVLSAAINANSCAIYSNSTSTRGFAVYNGTVSAFQSCSAGGAIVGGGYVSPATITDCPVITDPLASRAAPSYSLCDYHNTKITQGSQTLNPGVYCGGLAITGGSYVTLNPGVYIIKGGKLSVDKSSTLEGNLTGFYLADNAALVYFDPASTINLVAPADGPLAGILFFEDRGVKLGNQHVIASRNAPQLLGTLYFPRGQLSIGSTAPGPYDDAITTAIAACASLNLGYPCSPTQSNLAQYSAWTIIIANSVNVSFVMNVVLNTNYSASSTKPPQEISFKGAMLAQ